MSSKKHNIAVADDNYNRIMSATLNLDNAYNRKRTQIAVQMTRKMTTSNGCHVTQIFPQKSQSGVCRKIAEVFLTALEKGMKQS